MIKEYTTKEAIEYCLENLPRKKHNESRFDEFVTTIEKKGYESDETIDAFFDYLSFETDLRGFWGPGMIYYYIILAPKCRERLMKKIYLYSPLVNSFINFLKEFELQSDIDFVSKIIIEKRNEYPRSFSMLVSAGWDKVALKYCEILDEFPDAKTFEKVERDCEEKFNCPVGAYLLSECMKLIEGCKTLTKAEINFWNENLKLMKKWLTKTEYKAFLSKRYMLLYEQIEIFNRDVQEEVLIRFGQRSISRFLSKGNTKDIAYLLIGKALNKTSMPDLYNLMYKKSYQNKIIDWKGLGKIFEIAYEEVDPSNFEVKDKFERLINVSKDMLNESEELDPDDILGNLIRAIDL